MKIFFILCIQLYFTCLIFSQNNGSIQAPLVHSDQKNNSHPSPLNGDTSLGPSFNLSKCGLQYTTGTVTLMHRGNYTFNLQPAPLAITGITGGCRAIEKAFLYSDFSGNGAPMNVTLLNPNNVSVTFPMTLIGNDYDKCWGYNGTYSYRADVTSIISGNGNYFISGLPTDSLNSVDGATLFIIFSDATQSYNGEIYLFDGAHVAIGAMLTDSVTGFNACANASFAEGFMAIGDCQVANDQIAMNGGPLQPIGQSPDYWNYFQQPISITSGQNSSVFSVNSSTGADCVNWLLMGIYFRTSSCVTCIFPPVTTTVSSTNVDCFGNNTGTATANPSGGNPPYSYSWSSIPTQTTQTATGLSAGVYTVYITDATGCSVLGVTDTIAVTSPTLLGFSSPIIFNITCNGLNNGSVSITATGGSGPYSYSWSNTQTTSSVTGLSPGSYTLTVTDANGCIVNTIVQITQPPPLTLSTIHTDILCHGANTGSAIAFGGGGIGALSYLWSPGNYTTQNISTVTAGSYTVTITDANGCTLSAIVNILEPPAIIASVTYTNNLCSYGGSGTATASVSGGTGPLFISWWMPGWVYGSSLSGIYPGTHILYVTDANGCVDTVNFFISAPPPLSVSLLSQSNITICQGNNVTLYAFAQGGTAPYNLSWIPGNYVGTSYTVAPNSNTTYFVHATDANGCTGTGALIHVVVIPKPTAGISVSPSSIILFPGEFCFASVSQGATSYSWTMGDGIGSSTDQNFCYTYSDTGIFCPELIVYNNSGCSDTADVCVNEIGAIIPNVFSPNGDGINDLFFIYPTKDFSQFKLEIFDRWGEKMFETNSSKSGWDGRTPSGQNASDGTYYYTAQIIWTNGEALHKGGFVQLMR